jgi:hypothetical protein
MWILRYFNVLKQFAVPCHGYAIVLKELNQQFTLVQHFDLFDAMTLGRG